MQVPNHRTERMTAERMRVDAFRRELDRRDALHDRVSRYAQANVALILQSTACMALYHVQERCCGWLLVKEDRIRRDQFNLSQEFLAMMLPG